ncbi:MAG: MOSC domain-containing protein [Actinomycetota bacterium]
MPIVAGFNVTPVKSTSLHQPAWIDLRETGAVGDRRFLFVRDDGTRLSGISKAPLVRIYSEHDVETDHLRLTLAHGEIVEGAAGPVGEPIAVALFDRTVAARRLDPRFTEAIVRTVDETLQLMRVDEPEYAGGLHRVSLLSRASIADLAARGGAEALDPRRFRMLVEVDGCDPYEEDSWSRRRVRLGEAIVRVGEGMPRCVFTTLDPDTGAKDFPTLDVLAEHRKLGTDLLLGVYADVERPGVVRVGDDVELLDHR